jgi:hypothetical protein
MDRARALGGKRRKQKGNIPASWHLKSGDYRNRDNLPNWSEIYRSWKQPLGTNNIHDSLEYHRVSVMGSICLILARHPSQKRKSEEDSHHDEPITIYSSPRTLCYVVPVSRTSRFWTTPNGAPELIDLK